MASLLSINGNLRSLYDQPTNDAVREEDPQRSTGYAEIQIGHPLVCRYLYRLIRIDHGDRKQILVSTYVKTREEKTPAAEAVTYFNPNAKPLFRNTPVMSISDFGGKTYGHELCFYTKSYRGESIRLTSTVHELDSNDVTEAIATAVQTGTTLPIFSSVLPYAAGVNAAAGLFKKLIDIFNRDDTISEHDLDLHFNRLNSKTLQSGRIVCVPQKPDADFLPKSEGGNLEQSQFRLGKDNRLLHVMGVNDGKEYTDSDYFVIQVDAKRNDLYNDFDHYKGAAELLARTNRSEGLAANILDATSKIYGAAQDVFSIRKIEELSINASDPETKDLIKAELLGMSPDMQRVYQDRVAELIN